jgi:hypothetical protein
MSTAMATNGNNNNNSYYYNSNNNNKRNTTPQEFPFLLSMRPLTSHLCRRGYPRA